MTTPRPRLQVKPKIPGAIHVLVKGVLSRLGHMEQGNFSHGTNQKAIGTHGTCTLYPRAYREEPCTNNVKDSAEGVPPVPEPEHAPYIAPDDTVVIPFSSPRRYHWWNGGQSLSQTRKEIERHSMERRGV